MRAPLLLTETGRPLPAAIVAAPLLISGSVLQMTDYTLATYSNAAVIAVSQDRLGKAGTQVAGGKLAGCGDGKHGHPTAGADCTSVWAVRASRLFSSQPAI
eukprot:SAG22_NODE_595_length_8730_cov_4.200672_7_plen_101_part_00